MRTVELDWAADDPLDGDQVGSATADRLGLTVETVNPAGPGGGWPVLRFTGPSDRIDALVREYSHDLEDVDGDAHFYDV